MAAAAAASSTSTTATVASDTLHDIHLGASFLRRHDDDALVSLRYTQKPVSLGSAATGLLWVHPSSNANSTPPGTRNVLAAFPIETSTSSAQGGSGQQRTGEVRFTGQVQNSKDVDCVLVWDEQLQSFSLERLDSSVRLALDRSSAPHPYPTPDPTQPYHPLASNSAPTTTKRRKINPNGASTASSSSSSDEGTKPLSLASRAKHLLAGTDRGGGGKGSGSGSDTGRLNTPNASAGRSRTVSANAALPSSNRVANYRGHSKLAEVEDFGSVYLSDNSSRKVSSGLVLPNKNNNGSSTSGQDRTIQSSPIKPSSSSSTGLMSSPGAAPPFNTLQRSAAKESPRIVPPPIDLIPAPGSANTTARAAPPSRPTAASKRPTLPPAPPGPGQKGSKSTLPPAAMKRPVAAMKSVPSRIDVSDDSDGEDASSDEDEDDDDDDDDDEDEDDSDEDGSDEEEDDDAAIPEGYLATPGQVFAGHLAMRESNSLQGYATLDGGIAGGKGAGMVQGGELRGRSSMVQAIASGAMTRVSSAPPLSKSRDKQAMNVASSTVPTTSRSSNVAKDPSGSGSGSGNDASMIPGPPRGVGGIGKGKGAPPKAARAGKSVVVPPPPPPQRAQKGLPRTARTLAADTPDSESEED